MTTAILQMYDSWMDAIKKGEMVGLGVIDMFAAFDCVDVDLLLAKTKLYSFSRHAQQFVWSFMEGRLQVTEVGLHRHEHFKFREYIQDNEKSLLKGLTTRLNALKQIRNLPASSSN